MGVAQRSRVTLTQNLLLQINALVSKRQNQNIDSQMQHQTQPQKQLGMRQLAQLHSPLTFSISLLPTTTMSSRASPPGTPVRPTMSIESRSFLEVAPHHHHTLRTSASSASLRSREVTPQKMSVETNSSQSGGNVRVVVRVRGFLPRGLCSLGRIRIGIDLRRPCITRNRTWSNQLN